MSIIAQLFNTTVNVSRRTASYNSIGEEIDAWGVIKSNLKASLQAVSISDKKGLQGEEYLGTHKMYLNEYTILNSDRVIDNTTGFSFSVISSQDYKDPLSSVTHKKLILKRIEESS